MFSFCAKDTDVSAYLYSLGQLEQSISNPQYSVSNTKSSLGLHAPTVDLTSVIRDTKTCPAF